MEPTPQHRKSIFNLFVKRRLQQSNSDDFSRKSSLNNSFASNDSSPHKTSFQISFRKLRSLTAGKLNPFSPKSAFSPKNKPKKRVPTCIQKLEDSELYKKVLKWQKMLYLILEDPTSSRAAKVLFFFLLSCILFTIVQAMIDSFNNNDMNSSNALYTLEWIVSMAFTVELLLRWWSCTAFGMKRWKYLIRPLNLIDMVSLLPFYVNLFLESDNSSINRLRPLRIIRFFRLVRVLKVGRYMAGTETFLIGIKASIVSSGFIIYFVFVVNVMFAMALYYAEYGSTFDQIANPEKLIQNVLESMWWAIVTMSTTGYGDRVPQTTIGKVIGFLTAISGMLLLALPIVILGNHFQQAFTNKAESDRVEQYKERQRADNENLNDAQREIHFMNERIEMIEKTNNDITEILNRSKKIYNGVAKDLKHLYRSIYAGEEAAEEEKKDPQSEDEKKFSTDSKVETRIKIMEKLMKAKRKIKIASLFPKGAKTGNTNNDVEGSEKGKSNSDLSAMSPVPRKSITKELVFNFKKDDCLKKQETIFELEPEGEDIVAVTDRENAKAIPVKLYSNDISRRDSYYTSFKQTIAEKEEPKSPVKFYIKSNSDANENDLVSYYNKELAFLPVSVLEELISTEIGGGAGGNESKKRHLNPIRIRNNMKKMRLARKNSRLTQEITQQTAKTKKMWHLAERIVDLLDKNEVDKASNDAGTDTYQPLNDKATTIGPFQLKNTLQSKTEKITIESINILEEPN